MPQPRASGPSDAASLQSRLSRRVREGMPHRRRWQQQNFHSSAARDPGFLSGESRLAGPVGKMENGTSFGSAWDLLGLHVNACSDTACVEAPPHQRILAARVLAIRRDFGVPMALCKLLVVALHCRIIAQLSTYRQRQKRPAGLRMARRRSSCRLRAHSMTTPESVFCAIVRKRANPAWRCAIIVVCPVRQEGQKSGERIHAIERSVRGPAERRRCGRPSLTQRRYRRTIHWPDYRRLDYRPHVSLTHFLAGTLVAASFLALRVLESKNSLYQADPQRARLRKAVWLAALGHPRERLVFDCIASFRVVRKNAKGACQCRLNSSSAYLVLRKAFAPTIGRRTV